MFKLRTIVKLGPGERNRSNGTLLTVKRLKQIFHRIAFHSPTNKKKA